MRIDQVGVMPCDSRAFKIIALFGGPLGNSPCHRATTPRNYFAGTADFIAREGWTIAVRPLMGPKTCSFNFCITLDGHNFETCRPARIKIVLLADTFLSEVVLHCVAIAIRPWHVGIERILPPFLNSGKRFLLDTVLVQFDINVGGRSPSQVHS
ncbi:hypothetical protein HMPREF3087_05850 [Brevibacterium sp. HMSC22B09]|nr:hypothetical protein HMPREF3087_05850 [Brevibacterium sp. HMSC22B09]